MFYYMLNISESYVLTSSKPMMFDEMLAKIARAVILCKKDDKKITDFVQMMNKKDFYTSNIMPATTGGCPIKLDNTVPYKSLKLLWNQRMLMFMDGNYELIFDFNHKFVSITSTSAEFKFYVKKAGIGSISDLVSLVRQFMSGLCEVKENAPQLTPRKTKAEMLAAAVEEKKTPKPVAPVQEEKNGEEAMTTPQAVISANKSPSDDMPSDKKIEEEKNDSEDIKEEVNTAKEDADSFNELLNDANDEEVKREMEKAKATG